MQKTKKEMQQTGKRAYSSPFVEITKIEDASVLSQSPAWGDTHGTGFIEWDDLWN